MKTNIIFLAAALCLPFGMADARQTGGEDDNRFHGPFIENFNGKVSEFFDCHGRYDFRYFPGMPSFSEKGSDVMVMRIDPDDPAGAGRGPEIGTKKFTHFGTYKARIRVPDVKKVQPDIGSVVGYFTYRMDGRFGLSEIDFEWLIADPRLIYLGTWTGEGGKLQRIGRTINLATGEILYTIFRSAHDGNVNHPLTGEQNRPESIAPIKGYDASKRFYTYGFDWYPDRLTWWIVHPETNEKIILWDYVGTELFPFAPSPTGVPVSPTNYLLNFWHTDDWSVDTNPRSLEKPAYPYSLEVDWMSYEPFDETGRAWREEHNW